MEAENLQGQLSFKSIAETEKYRTGAKRIWAAIVDGIVFMLLPCRVSLFLSQAKSHRIVCVQRGLAVLQ